MITRSGVPGDPGIVGGHVGRQSHAAAFPATDGGESAVVVDEHDVHMLPLGARFVVQHHVAGFGCVAGSLVPALIPEVRGQRQHAGDAPMSGVGVGERLARSAHHPAGEVGTPGLVVAFGILRHPGLGRVFLPEDAHHRGTSRGQCGGVDDRKWRRCRARTVDADGATTRHDEGCDKGNQQQGPASGGTHAIQITEIAAGRFSASSFLGVPQPPVVGHPFGILAHAVRREEGVIPALAVIPFQ